MGSSLDEFRKEGKSGHYKARQEGHQEERTEVCGKEWIKNERMEARKEEWKSYRK